MANDDWASALEARTDLSQYGDNSIGLFALGLRFNIDDLASVAADAITDGSDDKKCDLIHIDLDEHAAVIQQCYVAKTQRASAPANKASDLNTAVGWLLQTAHSKLPDRIKSAAATLREALKSGTVTELHIWYVHNLPESKNVKEELAVVESTAKTALRAQVPDREVRVSALEVGAEQLSSWYGDSLSPILVNDSFKISVPSGFPMKSDNWEAYVTAIPASFLHKTYKRHRTKLFSANVRDYLGSRKSDQNINHGIKQTADDEPQNFWVFNNGLTLLVNDFSIKPGKDGQQLLNLKGLSIVNGAQTTGALG